MPHFTKYPQYPNTIGWVSENDWSEDETKPSVRAIKQEDDDDKQPVMKHRTATKGRQPRNVIKQEETEDVKPTQPNRPVVGTRNSTATDQATHKRTYEYGWASATKTAKARAERAGIVELLNSEVGRVVEGGRITGLYHLDKYAAEKHFIAYDGFDVVACIPELFMLETVIRDIAQLHIGRLNNSSYPDDIKLEKNWQKLKGSLDGSGWAVHIHPQAGSNVKRVREY
ncbi:hypothetical protein PG993_008488 [Apiospora rasikravindrae]|uniref:Uncharacterized protein n=1 Tax=Apiospora rasikravindrae TaxID=990691 RepID=A0ABR1T0H1_9PEZI